ncbi:hypothetical protein QAD02_017608 [Eretmocerus hayati]|uniref:Uncharacterized protein n=1 Tax=Eretmocerus hayati TaxID=131215 RepID=A0ACC2PEC0_9HYME|nr:hypothetical protein QAD02_017608 [Eretmocerus hayati]
MHHPPDPTLQLSPENSKALMNTTSVMMDYSDESGIHQDGFSQFSSSNPFNLSQDISTDSSDSANVCTGSSENGTVSSSPPSKRQRDGSLKSQRLNKNPFLHELVDPLSAPLPYDGGDDNVTQSRIEINPKPSSTADSQQPQRVSDQKVADVKKLSNSEQQVAPEPVLYSQGNSGPYVVFIEPIDSS